MSISLPAFEYLPTRQFLNRNDYPAGHRRARSRWISIPGGWNRSASNLATLQEGERDVFYVQADSNQLLEDNVDQLENQAGSVAEDGSLYTSILSDPIELEGSPEEGFTDGDYAELNDFVFNGSVLFGEEYAYFRYDRSQNRFVYTQEVEGIPVADGTSEISLFYGRDGNIISYQQTYAGPMTPQGSTQSIITDRQAIEILSQNRRNKLQLHSESAESFHTTVPCIWKT
ncbi:MAG: two-component system regulatory protein YycI [Alkalibacterium sp.]|nr:two-component system regulatory protein YycI [Alkalibacterium sp.]